MFIDRTQLLLMKPSGIDRKGLIKVSAYSLVVFLSVFSIYTFVSNALLARADSAIIWTDKLDYSPEETVLIFGSGFSPSTPLSVILTRPSDPPTTESCDSSYCDSRFLNGPLTSFSDGTFSNYNYLLDGIEGLYTIDISDGLTSAHTNFTDTPPKITTSAVEDLTPDYVTSGQLKIPILTFTLTSTKNGGDDFQGAKIQYSGTNKTDVVTVYLYKESDGSGGTFDPSTDVSCGNSSSPTGGGEFDLGNPPASCDLSKDVLQQFYIVVDVAASPTAGNTIDLYIPKDKLSFKSGTWPDSDTAINPAGYSTITICGNGSVEGNEECDDGNTISGDCCSSTCQTEPPATYYQDSDEDLFGNVAVNQQACSVPTGYVSDNTDCDDTQLLYVDGDSDGFGAGSPVACGVNTNTDCDDNDNVKFPGNTEVCDNKDNDCDNAVDEGLTKAADNVFGLCSANTQTCSAGLWSDDVGNYAPVAETCDNLDNDCDNAVDEGLTQSTNELGACSSNTETCVAGQYIPNNEYTPTAETCNNIDDNCNGNVDENLQRADDNTNGLCSQNIEVCSAGSWYDGQNNYVPTDEVCDNEDNNCDGSIDESLTRATSCGLGACAGNSGIETCTAGVWGGDTCDPFSGATQETCDNSDNDCDGITDEGLTQSTSNQNGLCLGNTESCSAGSWFGDVSNYIPTDEICDRLDNNCDGLVDELDQLSPTTTSDAPTGWHNHDVTVTLSAADSGVCGVQATYYCVDQTDACTPDTLGTEVSVTAEGTNYIRYLSIDDSGFGPGYSPLTYGNVETVKSATVNIDKTAPDAPQIFALRNGELTADTTPTIQWAALADSVTYNLQVSDKSDFSNLVVDDSSHADNSSTVGPLDLGKYFARVNATDLADNTGAFSDTITFTIGNFDIIESEAVGAGTKTLDKAGTINASLTLTTTGPTDIFTAKSDETVPSVSGFLSLGKLVSISAGDESAIQFPVEIRMYYTDAEVSAAGADESTLRIRYYNSTDSSFEIYDGHDASHLGGVDTAANFVWANVTHFSVFGIFGLPPAPIIAPAIVSAPLGGGLSQTAAVTSSNANVPIATATTTSRVTVTNIGKATLWYPAIIVDSICKETVTPSSLDSLKSGDSATFTVDFDCTGVPAGDYPVAYSLQISNARVIASRTYTLTVSPAGVVTVPNIVILSAATSGLTPGSTGTAIVTVQNSGNETASGTVVLDVPTGWVVAPSNAVVALEPGETKNVSFDITTPSSAGVPTGLGVLTGFASFLGVDAPNTAKIDVSVSYMTPTGMAVATKTAEVDVNPRFPLPVLIISVAGVAAAIVYYYFFRRKII